MEPSHDIIADHVDKFDGVTVRDLMKSIRERRHQIARAEVERRLARSDRFVCEDYWGKTLWRTDPEWTPWRASTRPPVTGKPLDGLGLLPWQKAAFAAWAEAGCRGVVVAVTGTGKTRMAVASAKTSLAAGGRVLVLVPTLDLMMQWRKVLREFIPKARIGMLGGGNDDDFFSHHVVIATPHSASQVPLDLPPDCGPSLLIADEAHRYGAAGFSKALQPQFVMRLACTATLERNDDGVEEYIGPYFGGVVFQYGYVEAVNDGTIARFKVAFVGSELEPIEQENYDRHDEQAKRLRRSLVNQHGFPKHWQRLFQSLSQAVAEADASGSYGSPRVRAARQYLKAVRERRVVAAQSAGKIDTASQIGRLLAESGQQAIVFCDTIEQSKQVAKAIARHGVAAEEIHSELSDKQRSIRLAQFRRGPDVEYGIQVAVAARVLDEGVDLPDVDLAIVLSAFRTRRQMIQRLGRVLRRKSDGRIARLVVVYANGTSEDPAKGAHKEFLGEILHVAEEVATFSMDREPDQVLAWLTD